MSHPTASDLGPDGTPQRVYINCLLKDLSLFFLCFFLIRAGGYLQINVPVHPRLDHPYTVPIV